MDDQQLLVVMTATVRHMPLVTQLIRNTSVITKEVCVCVLARLCVCCRGCMCSVYTVRARAHIIACASEGARGSSVKILAHTHDADQTLQDCRGLICGADSGAPANSAFDLIERRTSRARV
jgi:hypothetical protein